MSLQKITFAIGFIVFLTACTKEEVPTIPQGPQSVQGILRAADISLVRRGSHMLYKDGSEHVYVESSRVNLRSYENQNVTLSGSYHLNTNPTDLPVFVVDAVTSFEETVKEWLLPALGLTVEVPVAWERRSTAGKVHFHLPDTETPLITLYTQSRPTREEDLPKGVSIVIDGVPAVRQTNEESGGQTLYILQPEKLLVLDYAPPPAEAAENVRLDWLHMLSSITFERRITPKPTQPSSTAAGTACGGPAGILCPSGQYCEVTDVHSDIGVCKGL